MDEIREKVKTDAYRTQDLADRLVALGSCLS
jgi:hypothetical protein